MGHNNGDAGDRKPANAGCHMICGDVLQLKLSELSLLLDSTVTWMGPSR